MDYKNKVITVQQALDMVKSNDQIVTGLGAAEAISFMSQLHTIADRVSNVTVNNCLPQGNYEFIVNKEYNKSFNISGWFYCPSMRKAHDMGAASFIPNHLHLAGPKRMFHINKPNIYIGTASMPDKHGYVSLSTGNTYEKRMLEAADIAILEINPNYPRTFGDVQVHIDDVDYFIECDYPVPAIPDVPFTEKDKKIGEIIAEMVNDGDCIQLGIGGIPNAVAECLKSKKNLGVHTEMLTSGMVELAKLGVINGKCKQQNKGQIVCTFMLGNQELYDYANDNPSVLVMDGAYVNDPYVIAKNDNMVSINTTLEIDITGQCCSESIGSKQFSGTGGQADTVIGAQNSKNGRSIIALYSTAMVKNKETGEREEVSKIVPILKPGAIVSLSRNDVDIVVTEYGAAHLRGTDIKERVEALIAIAHPKFRDQIRKEAIAYGIIADR